MLTRRRTAYITAFVIVWNAIFLYQTFRYNHIGPLLKTELPAIPLLFPPAGWIMFYQVDSRFGNAEVYGVRGQEVVAIDPHAIFSTRSVLYDNFHRNILIGVAYRERAPSFCAYLQRRFPGFERFAVVYAQYPDIVNQPDTVQRGIAYQCPL
jgi:hypothetical protein